MDPLFRFSLQAMSLTAPLNAPIEHTGSSQEMAEVQLIHTLMPWMGEEIFHQGNDVDL
jgi:hypothetical protein